MYPNKDRNRVIALLSVTSLAFAVIVAKVAMASTMDFPPPTTTAVEVEAMRVEKMRDELKKRHHTYEVELLRLEKVKNPPTTTTTQPARSKDLKSVKLYGVAFEKEILEPTELRDLLSYVGFEGESLRMAWAIVMRESRGKPMAHNGNRNTGDNSYGLFQINMIGNLGKDRMERYNLSSYEELFIPIVNATVAYKMSGKGTDFGAWGVGPNAYNGGKVGDIPYWLTQYPEK